MQEIDIDGLISNQNFILYLLLGFFLILFLFEGYKFIKYKTRSDIMDLSLLAIVFLGTLIPFGDLFLSVLSVLFILMLIGTFELRESPVWLRLMASFTLTYGYLLFMILIANILEKIIPPTPDPTNPDVSIFYLTTFLGRISTDQISGFGFATLLWVLLFFSFVFFGRRFILVSRFLSPQYVYLFLYAIIYIGILSLNLPFEFRYLGIILANFFIYLNSGWILTLLFGIKPLTDERSLRLMEKVQERIGTKVRFIGIVEAPILNAFAYGPWFDQRFAFIVKDINDFTEEELLGIAAHEISHLKKKHTFWLLFIGLIDQAFRFIAGIPASLYDFPASGVQTRIYFGVPIEWNLFNYYIINIIFFSFALVFVRIMEGQADALTKKAGFGPQLAQALYTLEGYYHGIAGEIGLNAQLLTDYSRTDVEQRRFSGQAAINLHQRLMNPSRYGLVMNLIVSHPPTTFRLAALISDDFSPLRLALLPILLILPGTRERNIKRLRKHEEEFSKILSQKYIEDFTSIDNFVTTTTTYHYLSQYIGRGVLVRSLYNKNESPITGQLLDIIISGNISNPFMYQIKTPEGEEMVVSSHLYHLHIYEPNNYYVMKDLSVMTLQSSTKSKKKIKFIYKTEKGEKTLNYLGLPLIDFLRKDSLIFQSRGKNKFLSLSTINGISVDEFMHSMGNDTDLKDLDLNYLDNKEEFTFKGKELSFSLSPIIIIFYKRFKNENIHFLQNLIDKEVPITLYSAKDPDLGIPCIIKRVQDSENDALIFYQAIGEELEDHIKLKQLDAIILRYPFILANLKQEIGIFTKIYLKLANQGMQMKHIP